MDHDDDRKTENEYENDEHFKVWQSEFCIVNTYFYVVTKCL